MLPSAFYPAACGPNDEMPVGPDCDPPDMRSRELSLREGRQDAISGLKPKMLFGAGTVPDWEAKLIRPAHLSRASSLGQPDLHIGGKRGKLWRGAGSDAERIIVVFFGQSVGYALHLGAGSRSAFDRQISGLKLVIQPPARGVHHGRVPEGLLGLDHEVGEPELGCGPNPFGLVAGMACEGQIADPIRAAPALGDQVFDF